LPAFFRGAGIGTHWHKNDARVSGFTATKPHMPHTVDLLMSHVVYGTTDTPYVSLTSSYGIAKEYAINYSPPGKLSQNNPAYVYRIDIPQEINNLFILYDPINEIANANQNLPCNPNYHHDGGGYFLLGVIDPVKNSAELKKSASQPPPEWGTQRPPNLTNHLETMVRALRDAEILAFGTIPKEWITARYKVY
jgi:hypothetical protein